MPQFPVALSVLTPTWNRAPYLRRVWASLNAQTCRDFEWIVADDGSDDETEQVVRELAQESSFPVLYLKAEAHVGKARMDNEAIRRARGELTVWCDSDDQFTSVTVERLLAVWEGIDRTRRDAFVGVSALAATATGVIENPLANETPVDVSWNDLMMLHGATADMIWAARTESLKAHPFPEVDLVVPESSVWSVIGNAPTRLVSEVWMLVEYNAANAVSFSGKMSYNRGRAHALAITDREFSAYRTSWRWRAWRLITFHRYCRHGELNLYEAHELYCGSGTTALFWVTLPFGFLISCVDRLRGKVVHSHREFYANRSSPVTLNYLSTLETGG